MWKLRANRKQWDIAIANHTGPGAAPAPVTAFTLWKPDAVRVTSLLPPQV